MDRYEEALERAKEWEREHPNGYVIRDMMEHIFPGYNDSEDERTRKELIHFILYKAGQLLDEETEHKFVAYLEKQREQKPAEWSEEDGLARDFLLKQTEQSIKVLESLKTEKYIGSKGLGYVASDIRDWKNARQFILSLHPHWKPSEEQMEVDLEKEIEKWFDERGDAWENGEWSTNDIRSTARHFYELGLNARKEE